MTFVEAVTLPSSLVAAAVGLYAPVSEKRGAGLVAPWNESGAGKYKGETIMILGGSSNIGQYGAYEFLFFYTKSDISLAIQLVKLSGFSEIITTASEKHVEYLKELGATTVFTRSLSNAEILSSITSLSAPKVVFDPISHSETQDLALEVLALSGGGTLVRTLEPEIPAGKGTNVNVSDVVGTVYYPPNRPLGVELYKALPQLLKDGSIKVRVMSIL